MAKNRRPWVGACTENSVLIDYVTESPNVSGALTPGSDEFRLLQRLENSSVSQQGRFDPSRRPVRGQHCICARPSADFITIIAQTLIFGTDRKV